MLPSSINDSLTPFAIASAVMVIIGLLRPFVERLPFARPGASTHDATLQLLNVALNTAGVLAAASINHQLIGGAWLTLIIQVLTQSGGSHLIYHAATYARSAATATPATPATPSAPATPAPAVAAPVTPAPAATSPAIASASEVANAINAALAAAAHPAS